MPLPVVAVRPLAVPVVALEVAQLLTIESPMLTATGSVSAHPASGPATASASHCHHCRSGCQSQCQCRCHSCHWQSHSGTVAVVAQCTVQWHTGSLGLWKRCSGLALPESGSDSGTAQSAVHSAVSVHSLHRCAVAPCAQLLTHQADEDSAARRSCQLQL